MTSVGFEKLKIILQRRDDATRRATHILQHLPVGNVVHIILGHLPIDEAERIVERIEELSK